jgi:phosphoribosyl-ATP pyrophosphohydrolase/phosphoribosyl-AMP cyclohydrolase
MKEINIKYDSKGLVPAVIQNSITLDILMLGYMNKEAYRQTIDSGVVTFFSRSKNRLWVKGETSNNKLIVDNIYIDCDKDTILVLATPLGPTCHKGPLTCFDDENITNKTFINKLEGVIDSRIEGEYENSYIKKLYRNGVKEIAKKVTEEAGEAAISAVTKDGRLIEESADLLFHLVVLLKNQGFTFQEVLDELKTRNISQ